jgi:hypothetical protein
MVHPHSRSLHFDSIAKCPLCGASDIDADPNNVEIRYNDVPFRILLCNSCHVRFTDPMTAEQDIPLLYERDPTPRQSGKAGPSYLLRRLRNKLYISKYMPGHALHVLDLGCGDGVFAGLLSRSTKMSKVVASDFAATAPATLIGDKV